MSENICVAIRLRPLNSDEIQNSTVSAWKADPATGAINRVNGSKTYNFDHVFDEKCKTLQIYEKVARNIIFSAFEGKNGTIFAYGQTSTGKTYTIRGSPENHGIIPLAMKDLFDFVKKFPEREFLFRVSYLEIYNESIIDLLAPDSNKELRIFSSANSTVIVENLTKKVVVNIRDIMKEFDFGENSRHLGETQMNKESSRSHTIFQFNIESRNKSSILTNNSIRLSTINLVDLAGSESLRKAPVARFKESGHINKSLLTLERVIKCLSENSMNLSHIPYRDSKLTRILQPALGGNSRTAIIVTLTHSADYVDETQSSLSFASRARSVKNNVVINESLDDAAKIHRLEEKLLSLTKQLSSEDKTARQQPSEEIDCLRSELSASKKSEDAWKERFIRLRRRTQSGGGEKAERKGPGPSRDEAVPKGEEGERYEKLVLKVVRDVFGGIDCNGKDPKIWDAENPLIETVASVLRAMKANKENVSGAEALYFQFQNLFGDAAKNESKDRPNALKLSPHVQTSQNQKIADPKKPKRPLKTAFAASPAKRPKDGDEIEKFRLKLSKADSALEKAQTELRKQSERAERLERENGVLGEAKRESERAARGAEADAERAKAVLERRVAEIEGLGREKDKQIETQIRKMRDRFEQVEKENTEHKENMGKMEKEREKDLLDQIDITKKAEQRFGMAQQKFSEFKDKAESKITRLSSALSAAEGNAAASEKIIVDIDNLCASSLKSIGISPPHRPSTAPSYSPKPLVELALVSFKDKLSTAVSRSDQLLATLSSKAEAVKLAEAKAKALAAETDRLRNKIVSKDHTISEMERSVAKMEAQIQLKVERNDIKKQDGAAETTEKHIKKQDGAAETPDHLIKADKHHLENKQGAAEMELARRQTALMSRIGELESRNKMLQNELTRRDVQLAVRGDAEEEEMAETVKTAKRAADSPASTALINAEAVAREDALYAGYKAKLSKVCSEKDKRFDEFFAAASAKIAALKKQTREICERYSKAVDRASGLSAKCSALKDANKNLRLQCDRIWGRVRGFPARDFGEENDQINRLCGELSERLRAKVPGVFFDKIEKPTNNSETTFDLLKTAIKSLEEMQPIRKDEKDQRVFALTKSLCEVQRALSSTTKLYETHLLIVIKKLAKYIERCSVLGKASAKL